MRWLERRLKLNVRWRLHLERICSTMQLKVAWRWRSHASWWWRAHASWWWGTSQSTWFELFLGLAWWSWHKWIIDDRLCALCRSWPTALTSRFLLYDKILFFFSCCSFLLLVDKLLISSSSVSNFLTVRFFFFPEGLLNLLSLSFELLLYAILFFFLTTGFCIFLRFCFFHLTLQIHLKLTFLIDFCGFSCVCLFSDHELAWRSTLHLHLAWRSSLHLHLAWRSSLHLHLLVKWPNDFLANHMVLSTWNKLRGHLWLRSTKLDHLRLRLGRILNWWSSSTSPAVRIVGHLCLEFPSLKL